MAQTSVKYGLLGLLARRPAHGYDLKKSFEAAAGAHWNLNFGQIYTTLNRLVADRLIEAEEKTRSGPREKLTYYITSEGLDALADWVRDPVGRTKPLRDELYIKLLFADRRRPEHILTLLAEQRRLYEGSLAEARERAKRERAESLEPVPEQATKSDAGPGAASASAPSKLDRAIRLALAEAAVVRAEADLRWLDLCESKIKVAVDMLHAPSE
ncbi:MAG: PadR family transcriptional regulator [Bacillota bacterium]